MKSDYCAQLIRSEQYPSIMDSALFCFGLFLIARHRSKFPPNGLHVIIFINSSEEKMETTGYSFPFLCHTLQANILQGEKSHCLFHCISLIIALKI